MPLWSWLFPAAAIGLIGAMLTVPPGALLVAACTVALLGTVIASVHHAEVVAHCVGEPFGTLVLAVAIAVIEVALIITVMLAGDPDKAGLAHDTIFAAVMIIVKVVAATVLWNMVYLGRAVQALMDSGRTVDDTLLRHLSPLGWEHINLTGDYIWRQSRQVEQGELRLLRVGTEP